MPEDQARAYRAALTYALDELHAPYAAAVMFAHWHASIGHTLFDDDVDRSWQGWRDRPETDRTLGED